jgi:hypothetical protein
MSFGQASNSSLRSDGHREWCCSSLAPVASAQGRLAPPNSTALLPWSRRVAGLAQVCDRPPMQSSSREARRWWASGTFLAPSDVRLTSPRGSDTHAGPRKGSPGARGEGSSRRARPRKGQTWPHCATSRLGRGAAVRSPGATPSAGAGNVGSTRATSGGSLGRGHPPAAGTARLMGPRPENRRHGGISGTHGRLLPHHVPEARSRGDGE